ncbi:RNA polymerase II-specific transcription factor-like protein [Microdochium nivale]|nr:RNA polymerase II-specific transcription factor-like protein [Microdochium nivale]
MSVTMTTTTAASTKAEVHHRCTTTNLRTMGAGSNTDSGSSTTATRSRQKSCNACVLGKRRCDKTQPACARCLGRGVACQYGSRRRAQAQADFAVATPDLAAPLFPAAAFDVAMADDLQLPSGLEPDFTFQDMFQDLMDDSIGSDQALMLAGDHDDTLQVQTAANNQATLTILDYAKVAPMCEMYQPWHLADPNSNISLIVAAVKSFCTQYAQDSCTPYIHKELYRRSMPDCVLKAWTTCAQYSATSTSSSRGMILRSLYQNVADLHETMGASAAGASAGVGSRTALMTPTDRLGRLHALMFYNIIRMFDGDVTLGRDAARDMPLLEAWAMDMLAVRDNLDEHAALSSLLETGQQGPRSPPETWERWVFAESVRRSCLMAFAIVSLWRVLAREDLQDTCIGVWARKHRWTLSRHLWEAADSFEFFRAWREKPFFVISSFDFAGFLETGKPGDVDDFARILMTLWFGSAEMKEFTSGQGGQV